MLVWVIFLVVGIIPWYHLKFSMWLDIGIMNLWNVANKPISWNWMDSSYNRLFPIMINTDSILLQVFRPYNPQQWSTGVCCSASASPESCNLWWYVTELSRIWQDVHTEFCEKWCTKLHILFFLCFFFKWWPSVNHNKQG